MAKAIKSALKIAETDSEYVNKSLYLSRASWEELPRVEAEIDNWEQIDQILFIEEWPLEEQRLKRLERYALESRMTEDQLVRYEELKKLVARNRPIIRRLQTS